MRSRHTVLLFIVACAIALWLAWLYFTSVPPVAEAPVVPATSTAATPEAAPMPSEATSARAEPAGATTSGATATSPLGAGMINATFTCTDGKSIGATFYPGNDTHVDLVLSDGRTLSVPRARSADGARYANADESFVFWNVGDTATITEHGTTTFTGCMAANEPGSEN